MAKKAIAEETIEVAPQKVEKTIVKKPTKPSWEIKDRTYLLKGGKQPLTYMMQGRHSRRFPLLWFDTNSNEQRELRYATNMNSPFRDEQKGEATLGHIMFQNGVLTVPKEKQNLQKLLSLYHPKRNVIYLSLIHI